MKMIRLALIVTALVSGWWVSKSRAATAPTRAKLADIDRRTAERGPAAKLPAESAPAAAALRGRLPGLTIEADAITGAPRLIQSPRGFLTGPDGEGAGVAEVAARAVAKTEDLRAVKTFLTEHRALFGHGPEALATAVKKRDFTDAHNGLRTVTWQQVVDGIPVFEALLKAHVTARGELVNIGSGWVRDGAAAADAGTRNRAAAIAAPAISAAEALARAAGSVGDVVKAEDIRPAADPEGVARRQAFTAPVLSDATAEYVWLPMAAGEMRLCWQTIFSSRSRSEMFLAEVDAVTGEVLLRRCLTEYISDASYRVYTSDSPAPLSPGYATPIATPPATVARALVTTPALNPTASPNGWIDDGVNETRGNNVDAHTDTNADNSPDLPRPQGSPARVFDFALDLAQAPSGYKDAAVTQLFYLCNVIHDRFYALGFTEAAGNFQTNNFSRGGLGNDAVQADAQDGSGTDNANFSTPPDGSAGRMQMYVFTGPTPDRDGDLDAEIVIHEYTHGLSNRLVGGGVGISALQPSGMGEGWSDFYGLCLLSEATDNVDGNYAAGAYASYLLTTSHTASYYYGIRRYPYTTDLTKNPLTYQDIDPGKAGAHAGIPLSPLFSTSNSNASEVHNQGEVWCVTLWEMRANLVRKHGFATGNNLALQLVTDGMKLAPANPTFLQARDAILQADLVLTSGANRNEMWAAFAKRGMGASATGPVSSTTTGVVENFDIPDDLGVSPSGVVSVTGTVGGPFPAATYTLINSGTAVVNWTVVDSQPWLAVTPAGGTLAAGATVAVAASFNTASRSLRSGSYAAALTFTNTTSNVVQTRTLNLAVEPFTETIFADGFESGTLDPARWTASGTATFRTQVTSANGPHGGTKHVTMDSSLDASNARNELTLTLDLAGRTSLILKFWANAFSDEPNGPPSYPFTTGADFDGVAISANGTTWYEVQPLRSLTGIYQQFTVDLDAAIAAAGISYTSAFKIRFNQYDNFGIPTDGIAIDDVLVARAFDNHLTLSLPAGIAENGGPVTGTVAALPSPAADLVVTLASSLQGQLGVPATVTIPADQPSATFTLTPTDDTVLNGTRVVAISATAAAPWVAAAGTVALQDNENATLGVTLPASVNEGAGTVNGSVTVSPAPGADVVVALASSNPAELTVPATVTILAGQTSAVFAGTVIDDPRIDGPVVTTITAAVTNWTTGSAQITVTDNESTALALTVPATLREGDGTATGTVQIAGTLTAPLVVSLASNDTTELTVPVTATILAGQTSATFTITVIDDPLADGAQPVGVTATTGGFTTATAATTVADNDAHHFALSAIGAAQLRNQAFALTVTAKDVNDATITNYTTTVSLTGTVAVTPAALTGWVNGVWTGNVTATAFGTGVVLTASDGLGHTGTSNAFDVGLGPFAKFGWSTVASPRVQDTYFGATITAQDVAGNSVPSFNGTATLRAQIPVNALLEIGTGTTAWDYPMHTFYHDTRTQVIYLASELSGPRRITSLALNVSVLPGQVMNAWTIRMKHTALANYPASGAQWESTGWTTVYQAAEAVTQTGWITFQFATPFEYDGTSNLIVDFSHDNASYTTSGTVLATSAATSRSLVFETDSNYGDPLTWSGTTPPPVSSTLVPNVRLNFQVVGAGNAAPVDPPLTGNFVNGVWAGQVSVPFSGTGLSLLATASGNVSGASNAFNVSPPSPPPGPSTTVLSEPFESTVLDPRWTITGTNFFRTLLTTANVPHGGLKHLTMDCSSLGLSRNEATLTVNLAGRTGVVLSFWAKSFNDEPNGPPPIPFTGGADFDGVAISADGNTWYEVRALRSLTASYAQLTVNLDAAVALYGLAYNANFKIRFNQYDDNPIATDGIAIDDILISATALSTLVVTAPAQVAEGAVGVSGTVALPVAATSPTTVTLTSSAPAKLTVPASVTVATGQTTAQFPLTVLDNTILDGSRNVVITAVSSGGAGSATVVVADNDLTTLALSAPASVTEGATGVTGTATLGAAPSTTLTFALSSSNTAALTVPATLVFNPGQSSATFPITVPDNTTIDGTRAVTVTASATGWPNATANVSVLDNESATLALTLPGSAREGDAPLAGTLTVGFVQTSPFTVALVSDNTGAITVPATVTIAAGSSSANFSATVVDDTATDGTQTATVTASATGVTSASKVVTVADNDVHHFTLSAVGDPQVRAAAFTFTVTAKDVNDVTITNYNTATPLAAANVSGAVAVTPASLTGWTNGVWSGLVTVNEFAAGVTLTVARGTAAQAVSNAFDVVLGPLHHFGISPVGTSQTQNTPFSVAISAQDAGNNPVPTFTGTAALTAGAPAPTNILSWIGYADTTATGEYTRTKQAISTFFTNYVETNTTVTDPAQLAAALAGKQVFLIPEQENAPAGTMGNLGTAWANVLSTFVNDGGVVIVCSYLLDEHLLLVNSGLMTATKGTPATSGTLARAADTVLTVGVSSLFTGFAYSPYSASNGVTSVQTSTGSFPVVLSRDVGAGHAVLIGTDFSSTALNMSRVVANAVAWAPSPPSVGQPIVPAATQPFFGGVWSGLVSVPFTGTNLRLKADDGAGHAGQSGAFTAVVRTNPTITAIADQTIDEDGATAALSFTVADGQTPAAALVVTAESSNPALLPEARITIGGSAASRTVTATPLANANGSAEITLTVTDGDGKTESAQFFVTVRAVNDAPAFTKGPDVSVVENAAPQGIAGWAGGLSAGPANESGQALDFLVANDNALLFSGAPEVASNGTLTFTPAPGANGSALVTVRIHDNGGTEFGGAETSAPQTFLIAVQAVNDPPSFAKGSDQLQLEDAGPQTVAGWATNLSAGPPDEAGQALGFIVGVDQPALFAVAPAIAPDGSLTYTPAPDANGSTLVTVRLQDNAGGNDTSAPQTFTITVLAVNDPPVFSKGSNESTGQNAGPQTIAGWATAIRSGPADEAGQTLDFIVTNDRPALFSAAPSVAPDGTLTFTPAPNTSGSATVTVQLHDSGGVAQGGVDRSAVQTFVITSGFVNDAPSFAMGPDLQVAQDAGPKTYPGWATQITSGPADEIAQLLDFQVTADRPEFFKVLPAIAPDGTLTFAPAPDASGVATIAVQLHDDGGTADGGSDLSAAKTFRIAVTTFAEELGVYNGLIAAPAGVAPSADRSGVIRVRVNRGGSFTGRLVLDDHAFALRGHVDRSGVPHFGSAAANAFVFRRPTPLALNFTLDVVNGSNLLTGTVNDGAATFAAFSAERALFTAKASAAPPFANLPPGLAGRYTVLLAAPADRDPATAPPGDGAATMVVGRSGDVRMVGRLGDGTPASFANTLSQSLVLPFYQSSARGRAVIGPVTFRETPAVSDLDGLGLMWFGAPRKGSTYPNGWPAGIRTDLIGSRYVRPDRFTPVIGPLGASRAEGNAALTFSQGGLTAPGIVQPLNFESDRGVRPVAPNQSAMRLEMHPATGLFDGRFVHPMTHQRVRMQGAVLQKQAIGSGAFWSDEASGAVRLTPK